MNTTHLNAAANRLQAVGAPSDEIGSVYDAIEALEKCKAACGASVPSGDHDYIDEALGLLRVTRSQRDDLASDNRGLMRVILNLTALIKSHRDDAADVLNEMRAYAGEREFDESDPIKASFDALKRITGEESKETETEVK